MMTTMISLYSQDKKNVTIFEALKLFTQYILHPHMYSISLLVHVSIDFYAIPLCILSIFSSAKEYEEKKGMIAHFNI